MTLDTGWAAPCHSCSCFISAAAMVVAEAIVVASLAVASFALGFKWASLRCSFRRLFLVTTLLPGILPFPPPLACPAPVSMDNILQLR